MGEFSLCSVDIIPGKSGLEAEICGDQVRFRANRIRVGRLIHKAKIVAVSQWSGWFSLDDAPIALKWEAFEWESESETGKR